ncbi:unnamed protein product [Merluccius merluccius]
MGTAVQQWRQRSQVVVGGTAGAVAGETGTAAEAKEMGTAAVMVAMGTAADAEDMGTAAKKVEVVHGLNVTVLSAPVSSQPLWTAPNTLNTLETPPQTMGPSHFYPMWIKCFDDLPYCFLRDYQSPLNCSKVQPTIPLHLAISPQFLLHEGYHLVYVGLTTPPEKTKFATTPL